MSDVDDQDQEPVEDGEGDLELSEEDADSVRGGVASADISITKKVDKASPKLF